MVKQLPPAFVGEQQVYGPHYRGGLAPPDWYWRQIAHPMAPWPPGPLHEQKQPPLAYGPPQDIYAPWQMFQPLAPQPQGWQIPEGYIFCVPVNSFPNPPPAAPNMAPHMAPNMVPHVVPNNIPNTCYVQLATRPTCAAVPAQPTHPSPPTPTPPPPPAPLPTAAPVRPEGPHRSRRGRGPRWADVSDDPEAPKAPEVPAAPAPAGRHNCRKWAPREEAASSAVANPTLLTDGSRGKGQGKGNWKNQSWKAKKPRGGRW
jgi:hypothetical protein